ncbi:MAG: bifunctional methylenetetrahydrofolate dehydrogenase/methenyltetrahydrofolate cyclohydrolase FolD [Candidatus Paracaedimonas acanthamoebae]|uniref:Bifunctional protein FolD n=1 Tax=Candidatus Paracaedimonas acanthamoebae TaxID=244581 RepID=A0A8J7PJ09_9PROT|nr:bifunctional methylenetetrahydrofolate dehydrogenase/methenyltetrahydrofolate cyclohydrolase FolD [Candidatus Paracaedimonas acanthamoebae]
MPMTPVLLDSRSLALQLKNNLKVQITEIQKTKNLTPGLAVIRVGDNLASKSYVASKCRQCQEVGIYSKEYYFPPLTPMEPILELIYQLNASETIHGILLQLPLPQHLDAFELIEAIDPVKDVDGLHPQNLGMLSLGQPTVIPCTPKGILTLLKSHKKDITGSHAVIVGRSILVGRPLAMLLLKEDCSVTVLHSKSRNISDITKTADILVAAVGQPQFIQQEWVKPGAIVLDVGINHIQGQKGQMEIVGDVDFENVSHVASAITPVPGGIGPMTVASLLENTVEAALRQIARQ